MMGKDPFLVAYAMMFDSRTVVTKETSKPRKLRANRHLPDVCKTMGVTWIDDFELYRRLDFRIKR